MQSMTLPTDLTADGNSTQMFFRMRQNWPTGQEVVLGQIKRHFKMPANPNATEAYKDLSYLSQAVHAHCVTLSSSHFRLQRGSSAATMGLLFWSLNNQWQAWLHVCCMYIVHICCMDDGWATDALTAAGSER